MLLINRRKPEAREKYSPSLDEFCAEHGIQFTTEITLPVLTEFRSQWKDRAISGGKKLERLVAFGRFLVDLGWWKENLALKLKRPKVTDPPTMPYTPNEVEMLLTACDQFTDWHGNTRQENSQRLRAFLLLLRYSGLRIGDASSCPVDRLAGNKLFLHTQRPGCPCTSRFQTSWWMHWMPVRARANNTGSGPVWGRETRLPATGDGHFGVCARLRVCRRGTPIVLGTHWPLNYYSKAFQRVSIVLGHSSVKVTERHYAPWVKSRQDQLEADLARVWRKDPLAQKAMLNGDMAIPDTATVQIAATYSRHEKTVAPN